VHLADAAIHPANGQIFARPGNKFDSGSGILAISAGVSSPHLRSSRFGMRLYASDERRGALDIAMMQRMGLRDLFV
jgi:hypothetical protein